MKYWLIVSLALVACSSGTPGSSGGSGGSSSGGGSGGSGGTGGIGGTGGAGDAAAGAGGASDAASPQDLARAETQAPGGDAPADRAGDLPAGGPTLDQCFMGLR